MRDNGLEQVVDEFLNALSRNEALGLLPLSDKALDCLPRMAGYVWTGSEERLSEFLAAHPEFYERSQASWMSSNATRLSSHGDAHLPHELVELGEDA